MTDASAEAPLGPQVKELLGEFTLDEGRVCLRDDALSRWAERLRSSPEAARPALVRELVAAAVKMQRIGAGAAAEGVQALLILAAVVGGSRDVVEDAFAQAGGDRAYERALGTERRTSLPGDPPAEGSRSVLDLMVGRKDPG